MQSTGDPMAVGVRRVLASAVTMLALGSLAGAPAACDNPAGCDRDQVRFQLRIGSQPDAQRNLNYWRLGYDCVNDGYILDEAGRRIGVYRLCTRCW